MRLGLLQFAPQVGDVDNNLNRADAILNKANPENLDLLVLPELAFTGYNFRSLRDISPFLEPTGAGITSVWARTTALKHNTIVIVGYPEKVDVSRRWPTSPEYYNSAIIVNQDGDTIGNYRKTHLYYTDETWALEGSGFYNGHLPDLGKAALGICMDINPYRFEAPWHSFEFAFHVLETRARLVIVSMAWLTTEDLQAWSSKTKEPCLDSLTYWVTRLEPLIRAEGDEEIIVVFCNRTGVEDEAVYAGTSAVIGIKDGEVSVYDMLARGDKELLVVDTDVPPKAKLVYRPDDGDKSVEVSGSEPQIPPNSHEAGQESSDVPDVLPPPSEKPDGPPDSRTEYSEPLMESGRRSAHSHVLLDSETLSTSGLSIPRTEFDESPISPRYFWRPPPLRTPLPSQIHNVDSHEEWRASPASRQGHDGYPKSTEHGVPRSTDGGPGSDFFGRVDRAIDVNTTREAHSKRPSSTKSRDMSRNRPKNSPPINSEKQLAHMQASGPTGNQNHDVKEIAKGATPDLRQMSLSPDLEKLGADLMVFEGESANRPRRDSLVCHVDDDDYVILKTERKDSAGKKKPSKADARNGRASSRSLSKSNDPSKQTNGRSHSKNKVPTGSPTYPHEMARDATPVRPASRGRHRGDSMTSPQSLSKKHSHSRIASNGASPAAEMTRRARRPVDGSPSVPSPPLHLQRQDPRSLISKAAGYKSPEPIDQRDVALPVRTARHQGRDPRSGLSRGAEPSPFTTKPSPRGSPETRVTETKTVETKVTAPKIVPDRVSTPKAMILPPEYDGSGTHQSAPTPAKKQESVLAAKCLPTEVQGERPRSAVW
ncbi:carbon-nitrogen hydrolase [Hypoxylon sp. NC1633]|nr:carbon-nitrogen hydrolase [Hypoxylon sp. NC1633]